MTGRDPSDRRLLAALAAELATLSTPLESLTALVSAHVRSTEGEARARALVQAQAVDDLAQRLAALGGLAGAVANGAAIEAALDAVSLSDLSGRLTAAILGGKIDRGSATAAPSPDAGDLMLFE